MLKAHSFFWKAKQGSSLLCSLHDQAKTQHAALPGPCQGVHDVGTQETSSSSPSSSSVRDHGSTRTISDRDYVALHSDESTDDLDAQKASFASTLRACGSIKALSTGRCIHHCILQSGLSQDIFLLNLLLQMYGKCGALLDALSCFSHMSVRDPFAWNFLIRILDQERQSLEAVLLYAHMLREGCLPDKHIYASVLSACASMRGLAWGIQMHACIVGQDMEFDAVVGGNLVSMYGKCGQITDASYVFHNLGERSAMSWTALISAYAEHGNGKDVIQLFEEMRHEGIPLDRVTFISILSACAGRAPLLEGKCMHKFILESGFSTELAVVNSLINMYGKCRSVKDAWEVFIELRERDLVSWSAMIAAFAESEHGLEAWETFCRMCQEGYAPNKVTFINILCACAEEDLLRAGKQLHAVIACQGYEPDLSVSTAIMNMYKNCGDLSNALVVYRDLPIRDEGSNVSILSVCANYGALVDGEVAHALITGYGVDSETNVCIALVNMYGKCGNLEEAQRTFDMAPRQEVILWNAMAATYAQNGQGVEVLGLFTQMRREKVQADKATYSTILTACSHAGLVEEACICFLLMDEALEVKPMADQYNCMADLLARIGQLMEASSLINNMPLKPTTASWVTLLSICRTQLDVKLGESSAKHVMELDPDQTGSYVILANIYCHELSE